MMGHVYPDKVYASPGSFRDMKFVYIHQLMHNYKNDLDHFSMVDLKVQVSECTLI